MLIRAVPVAVAAALLVAARFGAGPLVADATAADFTVRFSWGSTPVCATGIPKFVPNPAFAVNGVPPGTHALSFEMIDLDAPSFHHGGGVVAYHGQTVIAPGAFGYLGPCPPSGSHYYLWTVTALDRGTTFGRVLGRAKAGLSFPR